MFENLAQNLFAGVIGSLIATVIAVAASRATVFIRERRGVLTGMWLQTIFDSHGNILKKDRVTCRQLGSRVSGRISRWEPHDQIGKSWQFIAETRRSFFFGIYWSEDPQQNPGSHGTLQLYMTDESHMSGFYVRLNETHTAQGNFSSKLATCKVDWQRISDSHSVLQSNRSPEPRTAP